MVFGSEDLQRRQVEHTAVRARAGSPQTCMGMRTIMEWSLVRKVAAITRASHKHKPRAARGAGLYGDARSDKPAPRRNVGRRSADFHGGDGDENKLFLGSDLSLNIRKLHDAQRNGQGFGRVQQVQRIQEESGALNLGSDNLHRTNQSLSRCSAQKAGSHKLVFSVAPSCVTQHSYCWQMASAQQSGGTLRRRMNDKIADIALAAAEARARGRKRARRRLGKMNRVHEQFMSGGMVPVQAHKQEPETTTRIFGSIKCADDNNSTFYWKTVCSHVMLHPKNDPTEVCKADLRGVPGHHGKDVQLQ